MNPLTNMRNVKKLSERELQSLPKSSWHDEYRSSAWIFIGGLPYDLSEGDVMAIFSQYGEITNLNLVRDKDTGKQKGFCFICYEDQRSTILAVDNFNGTRVLGRILRVDHVKDYKPPKSTEPTNKIKIEKQDDEYNVNKVKSEFEIDIKEEFSMSQIKTEICTPEIKHEICTPKIKREICTPEIIRSPEYESNKKKNKSKDKNKKRHIKDKSKERDILYKHQRPRSKEKDRKTNHKSEHKSFEKERNNKRQRHSSSQEKDISKHSKTKSFKGNCSRDRIRDKDKYFNDCRKEYKNRDFDDRNTRKYHQKDGDHYKN